MPELQAFESIELAAKLPGGIPAEVLAVISARFFSEDACTKWFFDRYYPDGPRCPECRAPIVSERSLQSFRALRRFTCSGCGKQPRATHGTVLQNSSLSPRSLMLLAAMCGWGIEHREIARVIGIAPDTVREWRDKFAALAEVGH
ncbi:MAG: hypothetical protein WDA20_13975 [Desulfuromonadales bacterium]